ncbi:MAG: 4-(cytidine 5'-diphospho)-2-C-methyl-D-erythritol kinase [Muribaculaceae bacterium]
MISFPNAKINLGLNIVNRRPDGYHDIETVFYPICLEDSLEIVPAKASQPTTLQCHGITVDCPMEKNLVTKAFRLLQREFNLPEVEMHLYKHIPHGAGLGGGSSDASSALLMLNSMFSLGLSDSQLAQRAATLGADCAFFIYNKPMMATGIGNVFTPISLSLAGKHLLLVKPAIAVPTAQAYAQVTPKPAVTPLPQLLSQPIDRWQETVVNDFEASVFAQHPTLGNIKQQIIQAGAVYAAMSGSGSTLFGIFDNANMAERAQQLFTDCDTYCINLQ